jgi:phosphohistidine phosphatase
MQLYVIRHADALALGERGITEDDDRPLSEEGELQSRNLSLMLQQRASHLDAIFTSPLRRARQTGELIVHDWPGAPQVLNCDHLAMGSRRRSLARFLRDWGGNCAALIGHQPDLGEFIGWLIGCKKAQIEVGKASVALVECSDRPGKSQGTLKWLVTSQWFSQAVMPERKSHVS